MVASNIKYIASMFNYDTYLYYLDFANCDIKNVI